MLTSDVKLTFCIKKERNYSHMWKNLSRCIGKTVVEDFENKTEKKNNILGHKF